MPHQRARHILPILKKRLKLWPVLGVVGPRQVGKSTLLRDLLPDVVPSIYLTLDTKSVRDKAIKQPDHFIDVSLGENKNTLILDEVQKAPDLFDAVKVNVDRNRVPGKFILSGSTEFSKKTGVRESLTGRIGMLRLFPMTFAETEGGPFSSQFLKPYPLKKMPTQYQVMRRVRLGGMPGICFLRSEQERAAAFDGWLEAACYRDIQQIQGPRLSGDLALEALHALAKLEVPTLSELSSKLRVDSRRIKTHLEALEALYILIRLEPNALGVGKSMYYISDSGLADHLGGSELLQTKTWLLNECMAQYEYSGRTRPNITYYKSLKKSYLDFIIDDRKTKTAVLISDEETVSAYTLRAANAFLNKASGMQVWIAYPGRELFSESPKIKIIPWAAFA